MRIANDVIKVVAVKMKKVVGLRIEVSVIKIATEKKTRKENAIGIEINVTKKKKEKKIGIGNVNAIKKKIGNDATETRTEKKIRIEEIAIVIVTEKNVTKIKKEIVTVKEKRKGRGKMRRLEIENVILKNVTKIEIEKKSEIKTGIVIDVIKAGTEIVRSVIENQNQMVDLKNPRIMMTMVMIILEEGHRLLVSSVFKSKEVKLQLNTTICHFN